MTHAKKNLSQKSKRAVDDADETIEKKNRLAERSVDSSRVSNAVKQPGSSKDKFGKREASRK